MFYFETILCPKTIEPLLHQDFLAADDVEAVACDGVHLLAREGVDSASEDFLVHFNAVNTEADAVDDGIVEVLHARCAEVSRHVTVDEDFLAKVAEVVNEVQFLAEYGVVLQFNRDALVCVEGRSLARTGAMCVCIGEYDVRSHEVLVAFGAGTIMDFGRYPAYKLGIPFVAIPTLASSDGFTANICSAIINGQKKSTAMCAPILVVTDLDIIKGAPQRLVSSGINDILSKYISLVDWMISKLVCDEYYCPMVAELAEQALKHMREAADKYAATGVADHEAMTMAQMKSGLTMQLLNHSRAASGAEHLMAHLVEMHPPRFEEAEGIHGECVGVGTYLCAREYHRLAALPTPKAKAFEPLTEEWIREKFGDRLADGIIKELCTKIQTEEGVGK